MPIRKSVKDVNHVFGILFIDRFSARCACGHFLQDRKGSEDMPVFFP
jgi:hypothetical protein